MRRDEVVLQLEKSGIIAVIRLSDVRKLQGIIDALSAGGVKALEITMTTPGALDLLKKLSGEVGNDFILGVGTVLDAETARQAILAGAKFVVSPVLKSEIIQMSHRYDIAALPGAFTPTEILNAWEQGADLVKVFPATALGPHFFKDIHGPLPQVKLTPTGGVCLENAGDFIRAGAHCLGVGTALLDKELIRMSDWDGLAQKADAYVSAVRNARSE